MLFPQCAARACGLDGNFGQAGRVRIDDPGRVSAQAHLVEDSQGRFVVATASAGSAPPQPPTVFLVARLLPDGRPDSAFGTAGQTIYSPAQSSSATGVYDAAVDPQDRVVIVGNLAGVQQVGFVMRFGADGQPDPTFGSGAPVGVDLGPGSEFIRAVAIDASDRPVFVSTPIGAGRVAVGRLTATGSPDPGFDGDGVREVDFSADEPGLVPLAVGIAVDSQQRLVLGGGDGDQAFAARLLANGNDDPSFAGDGRMAFPTARPGESAEGRVHAFVLDASDRSLFAGEVVRIDATRALMAARVGTDGLPDAAFGGDGFVSLDVDLVPGGGERALGIRPRASGVTLVGAAQSGPGDTGTGGQHDFVLVHLDLAGNLDPLPCPANPARVSWQVSAQANDRAYDVVGGAQGFVLAGIAAVFGPQKTALGDLALVRLDPDAILADGFDR